MKNFVEEFKAFAMKGNVVDLAVAVVIGAAFGKIVSSLVENIVMPLIGLLLGGVNFTTWAYQIGEGDEAVVVAYGLFIQNVFDFLVIAFAVFMAIKLMSRLQKKEEEAPAAPKAPAEDIVLLREIRDSLKR
ncbi:MAG: large-conductance mechanosensitive channel protein MscL [Candidatus Paceibacterota bacterium]